MSTVAERLETLSIEVPASLIERLHEAGLLSSEFVAWALELGIREGEAIDRLVAEEVEAYRAERRNVAAGR